MPNFNLAADKATRQKALKARAEAHKARGGVGKNALVSLAVMQALADRGLAMPRPQDLAKMRGGMNPATASLHMRQLTKAGYLTHHGVGLFSIAKRGDIKHITGAKWKKEMREAFARLPETAARDGVATVAHTSFAESLNLPTQPTGDTKLLRQVRKALKPFAHYADKISAKQADDGVPTLIRSDGVHNGDFRAAKAALAALDAVLNTGAEKSTGGGADVDAELLPYL